ncbi:hypothetical protein DL93DRAFT_2083048 [Clavulina sp. PMI_390]|nr:hypothetical protein DL93DRAFT_2083048 [Clavulina sp. PMI_390]
MLGASRLGGSFATSRTRTLKSWNGATDEAILLAALTKAIQQSAGPLAGTNDVPDARSKTSKATPPPGALSIDQVLVEVRSKYRRATPLEAQAAAFPPTPHPEGPLAVLIDIRPDWQRLEEGEIPGALIVGRNVLEWRLDPQSDSRLLKPEGIAERYDNRLIIFCSEGYASTLTIPTLLTLGLHRATDIEGGFQAWKAAGLPTTGGSA